MSKFASEARFSFYLMWVLWVSSVWLFLVAGSELAVASGKSNIEYRFDEKAIDNWIRPQIQQSMVGAIFQKAYMNVVL